MTEKINVLVVDDEENILWLFEEGLDDENIRVYTAENGNNARAILEDNNISVCFVDIFLGEQNGIELVKEWSKRFQNIHFLVMTAQDTGSNVIESIKSGATDFFPKPFDLDVLRDKIISLSGKKSSEAPKHEEEKYDYETKNKTTLEIYKLIGKISATNISVLITGESGTGKEVIARMIHEKSSFSSKPFVPINMAAIPSELMESELFGHVKGSFTGAISDKKGKFEEADGGTIFLDEISEMDYSLQSKLLRVLQEREVTRIGSSKSTSFNARVIAASNKDLDQLVKDNKFREDLLYRLNVVTIELPPLRERKEDIPYLATHFLQKHKSIRNKVLSLNDDALGILIKYWWPGNIRELENVMQYAIVNSDTDVINAGCLPDKVFSNNGNVQGGSLSGSLHKLAEDILESETLSEKYEAYEEYIRIVEKPLIEAVLERTGNNKSVSAKLLGINRNTFRKKVKEHEFE